MPDPRLDLDDQRLIATVAATIGVPRADVAADKRSFVLHAPLELLARAALLPLVTPAARPAARERIAVLADEYERSGPPLPPPTAAGFDSHAAAAAVLADPAQHDAAATWLGQRAGPDQLPLLAGDLFLPSLEAAGHANIYLALLARYQPRGLPAGNMLRHPVHAIATGTGRRIAMRPVGRGEPVAAALAELDPIGPPSSGFIAPLVQHAESNGVLERLAGPAVRPFELLRFAAHAMLQGTADEAPYGWTHCLTLAQAPLLLTRFGCDAGAATFVAAAYLAAHWAGYGDGRVDLDHVPDPVDIGLSDVLRAEPAAAARRRRRRARHGGRVEPRCPPGQVHARLPRCRHLRPSRTAPVSRSGRLPERVVGTARRRVGPASRPDARSRSRLTAPRPESGGGSEQGANGGVAGRRRRCASAQ